MAAVEVKVPDIGDFKDVEIIEVLVKPGDRVQPEQSLITVESDKASMEIPSSAGGVVKEMKVKVGDKVSEGSLVLVLDAEGSAPAAAAPPQAAASAPRASSAAIPAASPPPAPGPRPQAAGSGDSVEVVVPDIGDFSDVSVIEVLVKPGDTVAVEQSLITVESDKASMEIPSSAAGVVKDLRVKVGDKVSQGSVVAVLQGTGAVAGRRAQRRRLLHLRRRAVSARRAASSDRGLARARADRTDRCAAARVAGDQEARTRARRAARRGQGQRTEGQDHAGGRAGIRQGGPRRHGADEGAGGQVAGRRARGRWRVPRRAAVAAGRLREVRADRAQGPVAHQEDQRPGAAPQLGDDPARHQPRRRRHHRARGVPRPRQQGEREVGHQGDDARVPDQGVGRGAEEVPRFQRQPRRRADRPQALLPHRLRGRHARTASSFRSSRTPTRRACCRSRRRWASSPRRRATASSRPAT